MNPISRYWYKFIGFILSSQYPFELPPPTDPDHVTSLAELVQEPYGTVKGHTISLWFYREGGRRGNVIEVMAAGHSNNLICGRVSALIHETLIELENVDTRCSKFA